MKAFKLMMMAGLFAFASTAMAQEQKVTITADDIKIASGEEAELVIKVNYDTEEVVVGTNFDLYLPDGILLKGFNSKDEMMTSTDDGGKASKRNYSKACTIDEEGVWGDEGDNTFIYDIKPKADKEGILFIIMDGDKLPWTSTNATLIKINVHAIADVAAKGFIKNIAFTNKENKSIDLGLLADSEFGVNVETVGINEVKAADATAPAYNLQGIRVNNAKGLIIRDGKKVVVK